MDEPQPQQNDVSPTLQYEQCEYCSRSFFKGKLKYHLKLCTPDNPMIISPKKSAREPSGKPPLQQKSLIFSKQQKTCPHCHAKLPSFLMEKHAERCASKECKEERVERSQQVNKKSSTEVNFKEKEDCTLPALKPSAPQGVTRHPIIKQSYRVKLREELRCLRKAQEIKQVQCPTCQRIFSKEASLRHIPICQTRVKNQQLSIALKKRKVSKSMVQQPRGNRTRRIAEQRVLQSPLINPE